MADMKLFDQANEAWDAGNDEKAFELFSLAASSRVVHAFNSIGYFYDQGIGVTKDPEKALHWYKKAARHNDVCAFSNLGVVYRDKGNLRRAKFWLEKAVEKGDADSALELAKIYLHSRASHSRAEAVRYLTLAAESSYITDDAKEEAVLLLKQVRRAT